MPIISDSETSDSNIYTFNDVVMEEEVVSSEVTDASANLIQVIKFM